MPKAPDGLSWEGAGHSSAVLQGKFEFKSWLPGFSGIYETYDLTRIGPDEEDIVKACH